MCARLASLTFGIDRQYWKHGVPMQSAASVKLVPKQLLAAVVAVLEPLF